MKRKPRPERQPKAGAFLLSIHEPDGSFLSLSGPLGTDFDAILYAAIDGRMGRVRERVPLSVGGRKLDPKAKAAR